MEEVMENLAALMQRLLEIQSGGRQRSPKLIAEDELLIDGLKKRLISATASQVNRTDGTRKELRTGDGGVCAG
jgi:hypothetical protein